MRSFIFLCLLLLNSNLMVVAQQVVPTNPSAFPFQGVVGSTEWVRHMRSLSIGYNQTALTSKHLTGPTSTSATARTGTSNPCNLLPNSDFEDQNSIPSGNFGNVYSPNGIYDELAEWRSTNGGTPLYLAANAPAGTAANTRSNTFGNVPQNTYNPGPHEGVVGLQLRHYEYSNGTVFDDQNYITPVNGPISLAPGMYYAAFYAYNVSSYNGYPFYDAFKLGMNLTTNSVVTNSYYTTYSRSNTSIESSGYVTNANWTRVSGLIDLSALSSPTPYYVNIGNLSPADHYNPNGVGFYLIDDVQLFKIPTAGSNISCLNSPIVLGEGCAIPGARYAWTKDGGNTAFATTLHPTVSPSTYATYTLTVTLPDGNTFSSDVTISDCNCTKQMQNIDVEDGNACTNGGTLYYVPVYDAGPYDPAYAGTFGFTWSVSGQAYADFVGYSPISGRMSLSVVPNRNFIQPEYEVTITYHYADGCTASTTNYQGWDASVCYPYRQAYSVTPNPATSQLTIAREPSPEAARSAGKKPDTTQVPIEVSLYNSFGKLVKEGKGSADQLILNVQDLPDGIYYLRSGVGKNATSKMIEVRH